MAKYAHLVLDDSTLHMLQHLTTFSDEELQQALDALAADQASKRRLLRKRKTSQ